ncbi:MAG: hypothetical protein COV35_01665 [Alphaproteobacteria bacterium CG11_big_fil_rev_8_21_14_0_20_39_49]|nr:MAG: hypothetical protein COV35_01665 [Alphaproteobacteria bacterium CG11_big_fil_rev_8_21_14_0_20_39_49]
MYKKIFIILILLSGASCSMINEPPSIFAGMENKAPDGTPTFRTGWKSGCETGLKVSGNTHYKIVHSFEFDPEKIENDEYNEAWYLGFDHCRWHVSSWQRRGGM